MADKPITRDQLAQLLNEDLSREYQAIIAYVVYSQVLKGAEYMNIADQLEQHAHQELQHALTISRQIDYLGKMPSVTPKPVKVSEKPRDMLKFDLDNENETIVNYRERIRQCEALGEFAMAEQIREILVQEQDHQIDLATALGEDVPDVSRLRAGGARKRAARARNRGGLRELRQPRREATEDIAKCPHKPLGCPTPNMATDPRGAICRRACSPFRASARSRSPMRAM